MHKPKHLTHTDEDLLDILGLPEVQQNHDAHEERRRHVNWGDYLANALPICSWPIDLDVPQGDTLPLEDIKQEGQISLNTYHQHNTSLIKPTQCIK